MGGPSSRRQRFRLLDARAARERPAGADRFDIRRLRVRWAAAARDVAPADEDRARDDRAVCACSSSDGSPAPAAALMPASASEVSFSSAAFSSASVSRSRAATSDSPRPSAHVAIVP